MSQYPRDVQHSTAPAAMAAMGVNGAFLRGTCEHHFLWDTHVVTLSCWDDASCHSSQQEL